MDFVEVVVVVVPEVVPVVVPEVVPVVVPLVDVSVVVGVGEGAVVIVQLRVAGLGSVMPDATARTANVCGPTTRPERAVGEVHAAHAPASSRHSNVDRHRLELKENDAVVAVTVPEGPAVMVVSGARCQLIRAHVAGRWALLRHDAERWVARWWCADLAADAAWWVGRAWAGATARRAALAQSKLHRAVLARFEYIGLLMRRAIRGHPGPRTGCALVEGSPNQSASRPAC